MSTLAVLGRFAAGSTLVTDFIMPDDNIDGEENRSSIEKLKDTVNKMGEPFKSRFTPEQLESRLKKSNFSEVVFHRNADLFEKYLGGDMSLASMPDDAVYLLSATV